MGERLHDAPEMKQIMDTLPHGVFVARTDGSIHYANDLWNRKTGKDHSQFDDVPWYECVEEQHLPAVLKAWNQLVKTGETIQLEAMVRRDDDSRRIIHFKMIRFNPEEGVDVFLAHADDITVTKQLAQVAEKNERRLAIMLEVMSEGVVLQDSDGQIMLSNPAAEEILGLSNDQLSGRTSLDPCWRSIYEDGSDYPGSEHPAMQALASGASFHDQLMGIHKPDGTLTWISINAVPIINPATGKPDSAVASFSDVTELKKSRDETRKQLDALHMVQIELEMRQRELEVINSQLKGMADTDVLTGLKNRRCLFERLRAEISLVERNGNPFGFALFDVDFFKSINDTFGHMAGDEVLKRVADALTSCARISDFVARYGGEEFAVVMPHTSRAQAEVAVERMLAEIRRIHWEGRQVTASAGVSLFSGLGASIDILIDEADKALYAAKGAGRNQVVMAG